MKFDINYIADLARLQLTAEEKRRLGPQLRSILSYVEKISKLKTDEIPPAFQTTGLKDVVREDKIDSAQSLTQEEVLSNALNTKGDFFKVPKIFEV